MLRLNGWISDNGYYPTIYYRKNTTQNIFCIKILLDGSNCAVRLSKCGQLLADMLKTVCVNRIDERGYVTYCFELKPQKQMKISSCDDIKDIGDYKISFSDDIVWDWRKCPHLLLTGNTGSGKTMLAQYIITCLLKQGVRVIYCDPKGDDSMRLFMRNHVSVTYKTDINDIADVVSELEQEMRSRQADLDNIGIAEAEFNPVYLFFDELIAFAKIAPKKTYEETARRLASIIVMGRSKRIFAGLILQRPDTTFVDGAVRDNLGCRIAMGHMSDTAYTMMWGSEFKDVRNHRQEIGSGLIYRQCFDTVPREFVAAYIEKGALNF